MWLTIKLHSDGNYERKILNVLYRIKWTKYLLKLPKQGDTYCKWKRIAVIVTRARNVGWYLCKPFSVYIVKCSSKMQMNFKNKVLLYIFSSFFLTYILISDA